MAIAELLQIQSHAGAYTARFHAAVAAAADEIPSDRKIHLIVDQRVAALHAKGLAKLAARSHAVHEVEALENNKSLEALPELVHRLVSDNVRRDHLLVAVGGGIIQDLTCFAASILFRGMDWAFLPTTLLAQADSCIGSKSSINAAGVKNLVGTFYPPRVIAIAAEFLSTLDRRDVRSGVGEMLKAHIIEGPDSFDRIAASYDALFADPAVMTHFIFGSLKIKQRLIEVDEFDRGVRNVMNYGHSFGHAIEAATEFAVPHGIAVTMGMDMANWVSNRIGRLPLHHFARMHPPLRRNYDGFERVDVPVDKLLEAIARDKKNTGSDLTLILPDSQSRIEKVRVAPDDAFRDACRDFLATGRA